jgi:hypothetical protein
LDHDVNRAHLALTALHGNAEIATAELRSLFEETKAVVGRPEVWRAIEFVAQELLRHRRVERMAMLRMVLRAVRIIHGEGFAMEKVRFWPGYPALAESAGRDPLVRLKPGDFLPLLWIPAALAAMLLMHALID